MNRVDSKKKNKEFEAIRLSGNVALWSLFLARFLLLLHLRHLTNPSSFSVCPGQFPGLCAFLAKTREPGFLPSASLLCVSAISFAPLWLSAACFTLRNPRLLLCKSILRGARQGGHCRCHSPSCRVCEHTCMCESMWLCVCACMPLHTQPPLCILCQ